MDSRAGAHIILGNSDISLFGLLILSGVYAAREHTGLFQSVSASGAGSMPGMNAARPTGYDELGPNDPAVRFAETGVGQLLISSTRSDHCRRMLFDNRTGSYYAAGEVFCGHRAAEATHRRGEEVVPAVVLATP